MNRFVRLFLLLPLALVAMQCHKEEAPPRIKVPPVPEEGSSTDTVTPPGERSPFVQPYEPAHYEPAIAHGEELTREKLEETAATKTPEALGFLIEHAGWSDATFREKNLQLFSERLPCYRYILSFREAAIPELVKSLGQPHGDGMDGTLVRLRTLTKLAGSKTTERLLGEAMGSGNRYLEAALNLLKKLPLQASPSDATGDEHESSAAKPEATDGR